MPNVNIDFFCPLDQNGKFIDLAAAIVTAAKQPKKQRLKFRNPHYSDFLESAKPLSDGSVLGTMARVRMKGLPGKFDSESYTLGDLGLPEKDGVSEEVHFLIDNPLQVVALLRNGHFRSSQVEALMADTTGLQFTLEPKVRADVWKRLQKFNHISTVAVKLKEPNFHPDLSDSLPAVSELIDEANKVAELASIEIVFKMKKGLANPQDVGPIKRLIRSFRDVGNTSKLFARGTEPDASKTEPIDFLRDRIVAGGEVDYGEGRRLDGSQCKLLLRQAVDKNRAFLESLLT